MGDCIHISTGTTQFNLKLKNSDFKRKYDGPLNTTPGNFEHAFAVQFLKADSEMKTILRVCVQRDMFQYLSIWFQSAMPIRMYSLGNRCRFGTLGVYFSSDENTYNLATIIRK